jgi:integrase
VDKSPEWCSTAVFTREEVETLLSDTRLPEDRRVLYALLFLTGMRIGEAVALRWNAWDASAQRLGRLRVSRDFHRKQRREKGVKTERPREVLVHPVLARVLDAWRQEGWKRKQGRPPTADDLVAPFRRGEHRRDPVVHAQLLEDLELLGLRGRRVRDTRRTFISLALADGAARDKLAWVTHGPKGDIVSLSLPWESLCAEVAKLKVELRPPSSPTGGVLPSDDAR